ncbi:hypothetical protein K439DRAFT_1341412 [Ramaria rubella]|nr:hypothetical protein K439DRAFT_1341412 [Ramaria rubella]
MTDVEWLTIGSQHYVAKHMFDVGNGPELITPCENMDFLYAEISHLKQGQYFLDKFTMQAEMMGVSILKDLEGLKLMNPDTHGGEKDSGIWWLIEPLHMPSVDHWSGTLCHLEPTGLMESTVAALAHFAYKWSKHSIVLADMQSSPGTLLSGKPGKIFFNHMTLSNLEGESGIGDYREKGICAFLEQHACGGICQCMRLAALNEHQEESDSEKSQEETEVTPDSPSHHRQSVRLHVHSG